MYVSKSHKDALSERTHSSRNDIVHTHLAKRCTNVTTVRQPLAPPETSSRLSWLVALLPAPVVMKRGLCKDGFSGEGDSAPSLFP